MDHKSNLLMVHIQWLLDGKNLCLKVRSGKSVAWLYVASHMVQSNINLLYYDVQQTHTLVMYHQVEQWCKLYVWRTIHVYKATHCTADDTNYSLQITHTSRDLNTVQRMRRILGTIRNSRSTLNVLAMWLYRYCEQKHTVDIDIQ